MTPNQTLSTVEPKPACHNRSKVSWHKRAMSVIPVTGQHFRRCEAPAKGDLVHMQRSLESIGYIPPAEAEATDSRQLVERAAAERA